MKTYSIRALTAFAVALCLGGTAFMATAPPLTPIQQMFILKEMKPDVERVGIIWKENSPQHEELMPRVQRAAAASEVQAFVAYVNDMEDVAPSYRTLRREHDIDVLWILEDDRALNNSVARDFLVRTATRDGVPILAPSEAWVDAGAPVTLQQVADNIQVVMNAAAAAATGLTVPDKYDTQYLTSR